MKVVILAGGLGSRLAEETQIKPKPMVEVGGRPLLWHIMHHYAHYDFKEFFIALGYKGDMIKRYFLDYSVLSRNVSINLATGKAETHGKECEDWNVHLIDTGLLTPTGGRVKRLQPWLSKETFAVTYGDGVCDINFDDLLRFHKSHGRVATVTAVRPPARFGGIVFDENWMVTAFIEKPQIGEGWVNGGFLIFEPEIFAYLDGAESSLEADVMERLVADNQLVAYRHEGFWQCMDTLRDKRLLESLWSEGRAGWKVWD